MSAKRITITDIARESGASPTTVSLVLRDKPGIGTRTRDRVLAAAQALGYERRLASADRRNSGVASVAILFRASGHERSLRVNPFYSWVLTGMEAVARSKGMNLLYGTVGVDGANQVIDRPGHLLDQDIDGAVVVGAFTVEAIERLLPAADFPVVLVDAPATPQRFDVIATDNAGGARAAVRHLVGAGHRAIALVTRAAGANPNFEDREAGYLAAMEAAGLATAIARVGPGTLAEALDRLLGERPETTALFCANDHFALDAIKAVTQRGYQVPNTLSVVGFDDIDHAEAVTPGLTTMAVDKVGMGRHAIRQLDYRMTWPAAAASCLVLSPWLVERGTVAPPFNATIATSTNGITTG